MKKLVIVILIVLSLCLAFLIGYPFISHRISHMTEKTYNYTDDYPVLYADELSQIFGDYSISAREECHIPGEHCGCGYNQDEVFYYQWTITYTDCCGQSMKCILKNSSSIYSQQLSWLSEQLQTHIETKYMSAYYGDNINNEQLISYCYCSIGNFCNSVSSDDNRSQYRFNKCNAYRKEIEKKEVIIPLSSMPYSKLISVYPMLFHITLSMAQNTTMSENEFNSISRNMADALASELGDDLNLHVFTEDRKRHTMAGFCIIHGKNVEHLNQSFEAAVFESYVGRYW